MKVVICGSYGDIEGFLKVLEHFQKEYGEVNVFPNIEHLRQSEPCIEAHHGSKNETEETITTRSKLMKIYFDHIEHADLVIIRNEKNGEEYYGVGTTIELGYALAKGKKIRFTRKPADSNILSLSINNSQLDWKCEEVP
jgi:nucleoside 2-deoxyribosyltransferase